MTASYQPQRRVRPVETPISPPMLAQVLAVLVEELGRERALADAGRVGLDDADHPVDAGRADAGAGAHTPPATGLDDVTNG
jgi:hypothetical protein